MGKSRYLVEMTVSYKYIVEFDEESKAFKDALEGYRDIIDAGGGIEDVLMHVIWNVGLRGTKDVEGVGQVTVNGVVGAFCKFPLSGINLVPEWEESSEYDVIKLE